MADNVPITAGSGTTIATDDVSGVQYQRTKISDGTPDSSDYVPGDSSRGLKVNPGRYRSITAAPTLSLTAYSLGDAVGGKLTFSNAGRFSGAGGKVVGVTLVDNDKEQAPLELALFNQDFTASSDNAAFAPSNADLAHALMSIPIGTYSAFSANAIGLGDRQYIQDGVPYVCNTTDLVGQLIARSAPTYSASAVLSVVLHLYQE